MARISGRLLAHETLQQQVGAVVVDQVAQIKVDVALVYNYEFPVGARETVLAAKAVLDSYRRKRPVALVL